MTSDNISKNDISSLDDNNSGDISSEEILSIPELAVDFLKDLMASVTNMSEAMNSGNTTEVNDMATNMSETLLRKVLPLKNPSITEDLEKDKDIIAIKNRFTQDMQNIFNEG